MPTNSEESQSNEDINVQIDRFLQKLREDDPAVAEAPPAPEPVRPKKASPAAATSTPEAPLAAPAPPQKAPKKARAPQAPKAQPSVIEREKPKARPRAGNAFVRLTGGLRSAARGSGARVAPKPGVRVILIATGAVVIAVLAYGMLSIESVPISEGIATTRGPGDGQTVLIDKTTSANQGDLVVGVMPGTSGSDDEKYVMGTIFSANDETYAVYDGEVVWQVPIGDLKGKVLFASPTEFPGGN